LCRRARFFGLLLHAAFAAGLDPQLSGWSDEIGQAFSGTPSPCKGEGWGGGPAAQRFKR
jgi:hypothetical protein